MLEEHGVIRKYREGEMVFEQGDQVKEMYIIRSGKVRIFRETDDGEMAFFGSQTRSASAKAVDDAELLVVDKETLTNFIKDPVIWSILERMSERIREVDDKIEGLLVKDIVRKEHLKSIISRRRLV